MKSENGKHPPSPKGAEKYGYYRMKLRVAKPKGETCKHRLWLDIEIIPSDIGVQEAYVLRFEIIKAHIFNSPAMVVDQSADRSFLVMTHEPQFLMGERVLHVYADFRAMELVDVRVIYG